MEIFISTKAPAETPGGRVQNEKHAEFLKRRKASSQPFLSKREKKERRESKTPPHTVPKRTDSSAVHNAVGGYTAARGDKGGATAKPATTLGAAKAAEESHVAKVPRLGRVALPAETLTAAPMGYTPSDEGSREEPSLKHAISKAASVEVAAASEAAVDDGRRGSRQSRKNPLRLGDEAYSSFHLSAEALSANALINPVVSTQSSHIFSTVDSFSSFGLHPRLVALLKGPRSTGGFGLTAPTRVQCGALRSLLQGRSAFLKAQTGSGKTLAYLIPLIQRLQALPAKPKREDGTLALVLAPTRELCTQIFDVLQRLVQPFIWLVPGAITGGERRKSEKQRLRKGVSVLIATPGRLIDHLRSTEAFRHEKLQVLVLDEADRLMDMGFSEQVKDIMKLLSQTGQTGQLQTILASATATEAVKALLVEQMGQHDVVDADPLTEDAAATVLPQSFDAPKQLAQHSLNVTYKLKLPALCALLRQCFRDRQKVICFVSTTASVDYFASLFATAPWPHDAPPGAATAAHTAALFPGWPLLRLHGNMAQVERSAARKAFHPIKSGLLIATDVAARGLDLPDVDWVIQVDAPTAIEDYVHRIGRTARRGQPGSSLLFLSPNEGACLECLSRHGLNLSPLSLEATFERGLGAKGGPRVTALTLHEHLEGQVVKSAVLRELALDAFQSFMRAYAIHAGELKAAFAARSLHLGHVARSFALQDAPRTVRQAAPHVKKPVSSPAARNSKRGRVEVESGKGGPPESGRKPQATKPMSYEVTRSADGV